MTTKTNVIKIVTCTNEACEHTLHRNHLFEVPNGQYMDTLAYCPWCGRSFLAHRALKSTIAKGKDA